MHEFLKKNSTFVNVSIKNNKYGSDSIEEYTEQKGVKSALVKQRIITHLIYAGSTTITDLSKSMGLSVPTVTKFVDEMCKEGYVNDCGKLETSGGRHPSLYGLNADSAYFIGVAMAVQSLSLGQSTLRGMCFRPRWKFRSSWKIHRNVWNISVRK